MAGNQSLVYCLICSVPYVAFLEFRPVGNVRENFGGSAIITVRCTLTGNRGECLRVVGIHSDG